MGYGISIRIEAPFAEAAAQVRDALKAQGFGVLTEIDMRATLRDKLGQDMGQLDASIVTLALPTLQRTFHASLGAVTWVGLSYLLVLVATVTEVGRVADMADRELWASAVQGPFARWSVIYLRVR